MGNINTYKLLKSIVPLVLGLPAYSASIIVVQPVVSGAASAGPAFLANQEQFAQAIFGQIGLNIDFLPAVSDPALPTDYDGANANEASVFFQSASFQQAPTLTVWLVNTITYNGFSDRGLSQQYGINAASWIAASAVNDTMAHELGTVLSGLQEVSGSPTNLLEVGTDRNIPPAIGNIFAGSNYDQITSSQAQFILGNDQYVQPVPEPRTSLLTLLGLLAAAATARFQGRIFKTLCQNLGRR